jgi:hypothetical protein
MKEIEKLRVLVPHWIEHNEEHADEFRRWGKKSTDISQDLLAAADTIAKTNEILEAALRKIGGPLEYDHEHKDHE